MLLIYLFAGEGDITAAANGAVPESAPTAAPEHTVSYLELDINFFKWNKLARITFYQLINKVSAMDLRIAFVVQGNTEETQPERVLGCVELRYFDFGDVVQTLLDEGED